ncbi:hypothetical protein JOD60_001792 [Microbacterium aurum]|nr:hypothetical protein [Microbacterium aurum]
MVPCTPRRGPFALLEPSEAAKGIDPTRTPTASIASETTHARHSTFLWWSPRFTFASETSSRIAGTSGLCRCTGWPVIDARAISTGSIPKCAALSESTGRMPK